MELVIKIGERKEYDGTVLAIIGEVTTPREIDVKDYSQFDDKARRFVELHQFLKEQVYEWYQKKGIPLAPIRVFSSSNSL